MVVSNLVIFFKYSSLFYTIFYKLGSLIFAMLLLMVCLSICYSRLYVLILDGNELCPAIFPVV